MSAEDSTQRYRPGLHVHFYFWVGLVTVSVAPFLYVSRRLFDGEHVPQGLSAFLLSVVAFQALFWFARRRCSSDTLPVWDGLLHITAYMTIGVGTYSMFVAVPCAAVAVVATAGIGLLSFFERDPQNAQQRFMRLVAWFSRHRMYQ